MTPAARAELNRRNFLKSAGALIVGFRMLGGDAAQAQFGQAPLPGAPPMDQVDSWIAIAADGSITAFSGKEELGQGISTAQQQLVAEELSVPFERVKLIYCDTALTPDQAYTSGSQSHPANFNHGNLAQASATAREALLKMASQQLNVPVDRLTATNGVISVKGDASKKVTYGQLVNGKKLNVTHRQAGQTQTRQRMDRPRQAHRPSGYGGDGDWPVRIRPQRAPARNAARPSGASTRRRRNRHQRR